MSAWPLTFRSALPGRLSADTAAPAYRLPGRTARMIVLVTVIAVVSVIDLYLTLLYLRNGGMGESNPIARWVMGMNCSWILGVWKVVLVTGACGLLLYARRRWTAELGAWFCAVVMVWLGARWMNYIDITHASSHSSLATIAEVQPENWVEFN